jgi:hypothetical protein
VGAGNGVVTSVSPNQFLVRAAGGVVFWSTAGTTFPTSPGVALYSGGSAWSNLSDADSKENFVDLVGEDVPGQTRRDARARMELQSPGRRDPACRTHRAGLPRGLRPGRGAPAHQSIDADGIALAAVQALEARTRELRDENAGLKEALAGLRRELEELKARR